jgi:hypothetical protein
MKCLALVLLIAVSVSPKHCFQKYVGIYFKFQSQIQSGHADYDYDNFVEDMMDMQNELFVGHSFFQEQYFRSPAYFSLYLNRFNSYMVFVIGTAVDYGNQITIDTYRALEEMGAREECEDLWETYQARYGRNMQTCSEYGLEELQWMVFFYDFLIRWSENYITNEVQTHAMQQFTYWNPLTYPEYDVFATIKNDFRYTLDSFYRDYVEWIEYYRNQYVLMMDHIIRDVDNCADGMVNSYEVTAAVFLNNAEAGRC